MFFVCNYFSVQYTVMRFSAYCRANIWLEYAKLLSNYLHPLYYALQFCKVHIFHTVHQLKTKFLTFFLYDFIESWDFFLKFCNLDTYHVFSEEKWFSWPRMARNHVPRLKKCV